MTTRTPAARVHAFADTARLGRRIARAAGLSFTEVGVRHFPDGESLVRIRPPAGHHAVLIRSLHDPNLKLVETLLAANALRHAGARRLTLVAPYMPYMRQDAVFTRGEAFSQQVVGELLGRDFDRVLTVEAHLHRIRRLAEVMGTHARSLSAAPVLAAWVRRTRGRCLVVGPDEESRPWIQAIARRADRPWAVGKKERLSDRAVRIRFPQLPPCTRAVIVDDIASSGVTLAVAAHALRAAGIGTIDAMVVHAIFAPGALERIRAAGVRRIVSCDTVPHPTNAIRVAPLLVPFLADR